MTRIALVSAVVTVLALTGCTSSDSGGGNDGPGPTHESSSAPEVPTGPDCAAVWKPGSTLPDDYTRCVANGDYGTQDVTKCLDASRLVVFSDTYFAVTGGKIAQPDIAPLQDTEEFGAAYAECTGE